MKKFLLSQNYNFPFRLLGLQHILMIVCTVILFYLVYKLKDKFNDERAIKKLKIFMAIIILLNMFIYRGSYIFYGVYNVKVHLSLYYCHIVNYLFVLSLVINYNNFYKVIYGLAWIGSIWAVLFPDLSGGIDCFIFYSSYISHNLLLVFITFIMVIRNINFKFFDIIKSLFYCSIIIGITYVINYDFGTKFNTPSSILKNYIIYGKYGKYVILYIMGFIGCTVGFIINKIYRRLKCCKNEVI